MNFIGKMLYSVVTGFVSTIVSGLIMQKLWAWFVIPVFPSAPQLDYLHAIGLMMVIGFMLLGLMSAFVFEIIEVKALINGDKSKQEIMSGTRNLIVLVFTYPFVYLMALVWHQFIR